MDPGKDVKKALRDMKKSSHDDPSGGGHVAHDPLRPDPTRGRPHSGGRNPRKPHQLNGNNGEATNGDDMPKNAAAREARRAARQGKGREQGESGAQFTNVTSAEALRNKGISLAFAHAMQTPFAPSTYGIRVPGMSNKNTVPYHTSTEVSITSNGSGLAAIMLLPSLGLFAIDMMGGSIAGIGGYQQFSANSNLWYAVSPNTLAATCSSQTVAAAGYQVMCNLPLMTAQGRCYAVPLPIGDGIPAFNSLMNTAANTGNIVKTICGQASSTLQSQAILSYPDVVKIDMAAVVEQAVQIANIPNTTDFFKMKEVLDNSNSYGPAYSATSAVDDSLVINSSTGVIQSGGSKDSTRADGGSAWVFFFEGLPASSVGCVTIRSIMHIEAVPTLPTTVGGLVPSVQFGSFYTSEETAQRAMHMARSVGVARIDHSSNLDNLHPALPGGGGNPVAPVTSLVTNVGKGLSTLGNLATKAYGLYKNPMIKSGFDALVRWGISQVPKLLAPAARTAAPLLLL